MTHSDREIREALMREDEGALHELGEEQNIFEMIFSVFRGRNRWLNIVSSLVVVAVFAFSIYAILRFLGAEEIKDLILWAVIFSLGVFMTMMLKIWFWMEMNKNAVVREILRLELRIVELEKRLGRG